MKRCQDPFQLAKQPGTEKEKVSGPAASSVVLLDRVGGLGKEKVSGPCQDPFQLAKQPGTGEKGVRFRI